MAIIYSYPSAQSLSGNDLLVVSKKENNFSTKSVTLSKLVEFINGQPSGGVGTTNAVVKFTDGPGGLIGDSIMNEDVDKINLNGILSIAESNNQKLEVKFGTDSDLTHDNTPGANNNFIIGRAGDLIIRNRARTRDILFQADNGENDGNVATYFRLDGSMADLGNPDLYTRWGDNSRIVLGNSANVNNLDFQMYHDGSDTYMQSDNGSVNIESKGGLFIKNEDASEIEIHNDRNSDLTLRSEGDVRLIGSGFNQYFRVDSGLGFSVASKDIRFSDNIKAKFGTGGDFGIFHNGSNSYLENDTGDLYIRNNSDDRDIIFQTDDGAGNTVTYFQCDGSEAGSGFTITLWPDNNQIGLGTGKDLRIYHQSSDNTSRIQNLTNDLIITNDANDGDIIFKSDNGSGGTTDYIILDGGDVSTRIETIKVLIPNLPTSDPGVTGQLWNDSGTLKIST